MLAARDTDLAGIVARHGMPPLWPREPGFASLVRIVIEQQVSLASADAAYGRLASAAGGVAPELLLRLDEAGIRAAGITRQKARYLVALSAAVLTGALDLDALPHLDDDAARGALMQVIGVGRWTADVYLLLAMRRPDIWPVGDIALAASVRYVKRLERLPSPDELGEIGRVWTPFRAAAARLLWHSYLAGDRPARAPSEREVARGRHSDDGDRDEDRVREAGGMQRRL